MSFRPPRALRTTITHGITLVLVAFAIISVGCSVLAGTGTYRTATILTGSMANIYPPGTVVVLQEVSTRTLREGDIVSVMPPGGTIPVIHRLIKIIDEDGVGKGDIPTQQDTTEGAGSRDTATVSLTDAMLLAPGLKRPDRPQPLVVTKGDANPIADTWAPLRLGETVWVPKNVPVLAPDSRLRAGRIVLSSVANPWVTRLVAGLSMLLVGWPVVWRMWSGKRRSGQDDEEDLREAEEFAATLGDPLSASLNRERERAQIDLGFEDPELTAVAPAASPRRRRR